jgi:transcriptional regulator with XRE-family HTH domain
MDNTFGYKLNALKLARNLTSAELAHKAGISEGLLSGLIHNQRVIGEYTARKIGQALQLHGEELEDFVFAAINNCSEKTLASSKHYPAELINLVAGKLHEQGILPTEISRCIRKEKDADAAIYLNDGREALIKLEFAFA